MRQEQARRMKKKAKQKMKTYGSSQSKKIQVAIDSLKKKGKQETANGIKAEDIKACDDETKRLMREIFSEVIRCEDITPEAWRRIRIKVIYKKGDVERAENYRSICTLPTLYKLFSTFLHNRLYNKLHRRQPLDQGGFRRSYQTLDHLATYRLLEQRSREWGVKKWIATVDFAKAFDTIRHRALWKALARFEIDTPVHQLLEEAIRIAASDRLDRQRK